MGSEKTCGPWERAEAAVHVGAPRRTVNCDDDIFDDSNPRIKEDILRMVLQYLQDEGYGASTMVLQDEANMRAKEQIRNHSHFKLIKKAILEGDWAEVDKLVQKTSLKEHSQFQYSIYKQQFLELIEQMEFQKAFTLLNKRLKPLEPQGVLQNEFRDLCYLLTCKTVQDSPSFKHWEGISASREKLVEHVSAMLDLDTDALSEPQQEVKQHRLVHLLKQAVCYQIEFSRYHPRVLPQIGTLLEDYTCFVLPNASKATFRGHRENVKCVDFVGQEGAMLVSGSSDNTVRLWSVEGGQCVQVLGGGETAGSGGHTSRVWDVSSSSTGDLVASASGDATVKLWSIRGSAKDGGPQSPLTTLEGHEGDVYSVKFHPSNCHVATGGYDKTVRVWDVRTGTLLHTLSGHNASVSRAVFNPHGNLLISASKDSTIKFWDLVSGVCVKTFSSHLGEVTSVEMNRSGQLMLSGSKDNSNRLWDVRLARPIQRFKGHQNTSKNFVRAGFGPNEDLVVSGSEDGFVYIWDASTGELLQRLGSESDDGHTGIVYRAIWNANQSLLASCAHDNTIKTWWYDDKCPFVKDQEEEI